MQLTTRENHGGLQDPDANRASASCSVTVQDSPRMLEPDVPACARGTTRRLPPRHHINTLNQVLLPQNFLSGVARLAGVSRAGHRASRANGQTITTWKATRRRSEPIDLVCNSLGLHGSWIGPDWQARHTTRWAGVCVRPSSAGGPVPYTSRGSPGALDGDKTSSRDAQSYCDDMGHVLSSGSSHGHCPIIPR
jgi:hypothetical protein